MGTMSGIKATLGLSGSGVPSGVNVDSVARLGVSYSDVSFSTADVFYSVKFEAPSTGTYTAQLDLATGAASHVGGPGTTLITRRTGETDNLSAVDFEGAAIPAIGTVYAILFLANELNDNNNVTVTPSNSSIPGCVMQGGDNLLISKPLGLTSPGTINFTIVGQAGGVTSITVIVASEAS